MEDVNHPLKTTPLQGAVGMAIRDEDARIRKSSSESHDAHPAVRQDFARTNDEGTGMTREERIRNLRNEWEQTALPNVPQIPGYHLCWLSTNHPYDSIQKRMRLGYELVKLSEMIGFDHQKANSGQYSDFVSINEMVLGKIPEELYQMMMQEFHHDRPMREEESVYSGIQANSAKDGAGRKLSTPEEGFRQEALIQRRKVPTFQ